MQSSSLSTQSYSIHKNYDLIQEDRIKQVNLLLPGEEMEISSTIHSIKLYANDEKKQFLIDQEEHGNDDHDRKDENLKEMKTMFHADQEKDEKEVIKNIDHLFVLKDLLHPDECQDILSIEKKNREEEKNGFESIQSEYPAEYRNSTRIIYNDKELAQKLWRRMKKHLVKYSFVRPFGLDNGGNWVPIGVNECCRLSKYEPGNYFKPHVDSQFVRNSDERSVYTLLIYLNDDFNGGETRFLRAINDNVPTNVKVKKKSRSDKKMAKKKFAKEATKLSRFNDQPENSLKDSALQFKHLCTVRPKIGSAAIFNHDLYHEGRAVTNGIKYILRTEIMFKRVDSNSVLKKEDTKLYDRVMATLKQSDDLEKKGKVYESTEYYRKVQDMLIMNGHSMSLLMVPKFKRKSNFENVPESFDDELSILPEETLNNIFSFLNDWEICQLILPLDKYFHHFGRNNQLWESLYMHKWGNTITELLKRLYRRKNSELIQLNSSDNTTSIDETPLENDQDWYHIYIMKRYFEKEFEPVFFDVGMDHSTLSSINGDFKNVKSLLHRPKFSHYSASKFSSYKLASSKGYNRQMPITKSCEISSHYNIFILLLMSELKKTPQRHPVVLSLPSILMKDYNSNEETIKDKLFKSNIPAICILPRCFLLSVYYGVRTCLVLDISQVCLSVHAIVENDMDRIESLYFQFPIEVGVLALLEENDVSSFDKCKIVSMIDQILGQYSNDIRYKLSENIILSGEVVEDKKEHFDFLNGINSRFNSPYSRYKLKKFTEGPEAVKGAISFSKIPNFKDYCSYWFNHVNTFDLR